MTSKSAYKRQIRAKGGIADTVETARRFIKDETRRLERAKKREQAKFGLSFSLDAPKQSPVKWSRESHRKTTFKRFGML